MSSKKRLPKNVILKILKKCHPKNVIHKVTQTLTSRNRKIRVIKLKRKTRHIKAYESTLINLIVKHEKKHLINLIERDRRC